MNARDGGDDLGRPIRVVLFRGPFQPPAAMRLLIRLDDHPEVELVAGFCQVAGTGLRHRIRDVWRRRGILAAPILAGEGARAAGRLIIHPLRETESRRKAASIDRRTEIVPDIHAPDVLERVRDMRPDLGVIYGGPILKPALFGIPRFGTLSIHHGRLPAYRGKKTTFWEMYLGERTAGVAIQRIDAGLDTGEIAASGEVPIGSKSYHRVWRDVQDLGVDLYLDAILQTKHGTVSYRSQEGAGNLYRDPSWSQILDLEWRQLRARWR